MAVEAQRIETSISITAYRAPIVWQQGSAVSEEVAPRQHPLVAVVLPQGTEGATLAIQESHDGGASWQRTTREGTALTIAIAATAEGQVLHLTTPVPAGADRLRFVTLDGGGTQQTQSAERAGSALFAPTSG